MGVADSLIREMEELGCRVTIQNGQPSISRPSNPAHRHRFQRLVGALRNHREEVLDHLQGIQRERCPLCHRDVTCPEDKGVLAGVNPFCQRGLTMPPKWRSGEMVEKKHDGCPYRRP